MIRFKGTTYLHGLRSLLGFEFMPVLRETLVRIVNYDSDNRPYKTQRFPSIFVESGTSRKRYCNKHYWTYCCASLIPRRIIAEFCGRMLLSGNSIPGGTTLNVFPTKVCRYTTVIPAPLVFVSMGYGAIYTACIIPGIHRN